MGQRMGDSLNAVKAAGRLTKALLTGRRGLVDSIEARERLDECHSRKNSCFDADSGRCRVCRCFVEVKTRLATETCPKGYWKLVDKGT
jgi:hypothetical protein